MQHARQLFGKYSWYAFGMVLFEFATPYRDSDRPFGAANGLASLDKNKEKGERAWIVYRKSLYLADYVQAKTASQFQ